jgi:hypothetical protein
MEITLELTKLIVISIIFAFVFGLIRYAKKAQDTGETWDWMKFAPTAIYSVILGFIMAFTGVVNLNTLANFSALFDGTWIAYLSLFTFILYAWENLVIPFIKARLTVTKFYLVSVGIDPLNKMNPEIRKWLISDRPPEMRLKVLAAVDEAQAKGTYRYDINSGPWEYLVEFGIVTGGKHYLWKDWFGDGSVVWKSISVACLEAIRTTGKWPDYDKLY